VARDRQSTIIDGHRYEMTMLGATAGYRLFHRLFKMVGPSFGAIMDAVGQPGGVENTDLSSKVVVDAIRTLSEQVKESDLDHLVEQLRGQTHVGIGGTEMTVPLSGVFEAHFAGDVMGIGRWLIWGLKVQFATFADAFTTSKPPSGEGVTQAGTSQSP